MTAQIPQKHRLDPLLRLWLECIVLRSKERLVVLAESLASESWSELLLLAQAHGVLPLLYELPEIERFCAEKGVDCQVIRSAAARTALLDQLHLDLLHDVDQRLQVLNLPVLVIKGAALTKTHYHNAGSRPRVDTDLFLEPKNRGLWHALMQELGFSAVPSNFSSVVLPERSYQKQVAGAYLQLDVHWFLSSRPLLGKKLVFSTLYDAGLAFGTAKSLRMPRAIDALLIAVVHRLGHHRAQERYIWLYDIYLIWSKFDAGERNEALRAAETLGLATLVYEALQSTSTLFPFAAGLPEPPRVNEVAAQLLNHAQSTFGFDWKHANWRERWLLLKERFWAEPSYLRQRYQASSAPVWLLQLRRWFS